MFPPSGAEIIRNEAGEPIGWDMPAEPEYCDECGLTHVGACPGFERDADEDDTEFRCDECGGYFESLDVDSYREAEYRDMIETEDPTGFICKLCSAKLFDLHNRSVFDPDGNRCWFANVYVIERVYGGPEEGGWWFDQGYPLRSYVVNSREAAEQLRDKLAGEYPKTGKRYSVLGGDDYEIYIERHAGEFWPRERPHYE